MCLSDRNESWKSHLKDEEKPRVSVTVGNRGERKWLEGVGPQQTWSDNLPSKKCEWVGDLQVQVAKIFKRHCGINQRKDWIWLVSSFYNCKTNVLNWIGIWVVLVWNFFGVILVWSGCLGVMDLFSFRGVRDTPILTPICMGRGISLRVPPLINPIKVFRKTQTAFTAQNNASFLKHSSVQGKKWSPWSSSTSLGNRDWIPTLYEHPTHRGSGYRLSSAATLWHKGPEKTSAECGIWGLAHIGNGCHRQWEVSFGPYLRSFAYLHAIGVLIQDPT